MKQYPTYKDSGIQWIGLIPEHWNVTKTKYIARLYTGNSLDDSQKEKYLTDPLEINESAIPYIATKDISSDCNCVTYYNGLAIPKEEDGFKKAPKGSFLLCVEGGSAGRKHAYLEHEVCFVNKLCCFDSSLNSRYHYYFIQTEPFRNHFKQMIQGLIGGVSVSDLNNMEVVVPSDSEQQAIAQFLDSKTAKIDESVLLYEQQKADLVEYRKALISNTVTRGLNPNVPLKESGIQWLGQIPEGWKIVPLKFLLASGMMYGANESADEPNMEWPRYIRITDIAENGSLKDETYMSLSPDKAADYMLQKGDILFARSGATVGKTYMFNENYPACFAGYLIKATCGKDLLPEFLLKYTQSSVYENWKNSIYIQSTIQNIGADKYNQMPIPVPSLTEQQAIVFFLDSKTAMIDEAIRRIDEQIADFKAYRTALITDAVTGKIDVR